MGVAFSGLTGWMLFGGLTLVLGAVGTRWLILPRRPLRDGPFVGELVAGTARVATLGATVLFVGVLFFFVRQLLEFRDPFSAWSDEATLLLGTPWGRTWLRACAGAGLLTVGCAVATRHAVGWWLATPLALALGAFPALTGHAAATERYTALFVAADTVHVWAAGAWIGGLAMIVWLERRSGRLGREGSLLPELVPAFSPVAVVSVGVLVGTGTLATIEHLDSWSLLVTTSWGRLLTAKLALVGVVLLLGGRNFRVLTPRLGTDHGDRAMRRSAMTELVVAQIVLIVTALLVRTSPMG